MADEARPYGGRRALVADDDEAILGLVSRLLEQQGLEVEGVANGQEALDAVGRRPFDLIITDLAMPGMTGLEFIRLARARGVDAEVIVLTAYGTVPSAVDAMKFGAFDFLEKPVRIDRMRAAIDGAMARRLAKARPEARTTGEERKRSWAPPSTTTSASPSVAPPPGTAAGRASTAPRPTTRPPAVSPEQIRSIGRYEVLEIIGRGSMGEVFRCRDPLIKRTVAVKVLRIASQKPDHVAEMIARFQREAAAAGALAHPGIVGVYDLGQDQRLGIWYIVLELVEGRGLERILGERRCLPVPEAVGIGFQVADALAFAHARGVVHRDIKPSNVLVREDGQLKLVDFGIAAVRGSELTATGQWFGSPSYMAPERIRGKSGGPAVDQFGLGVVLYEALTGGNPFYAETPAAALLRVLGHHPRPIDQVATEVPPPLAALVMRLMAKRAADRYADTGEVADELGRIGGTLGLKLVRYAGPEPA
jgi:CheY-like chemotaxis protein